MNRWKVILAAALIFATGAATGALALRAAGKAGRAPWKTERRASPVDGRFEPLQRMQAELSLSPEQATRIEAILQDGRRRTRQIWEGIQPQLREETKLVRERIRAELTADQRLRYDELLKRSRDRRGARPDAANRLTAPHSPRGAATSPPPAAPRPAPTP